MTKHLLEDFILNLCSNLFAQSVCSRGQETYPLIFEIPGQWGKRSVMLKLTMMNGLDVAEHLTLYKNIELLYNCG